MNKRLELNSLAPYERVCQACQKVKGALEFSRARRTCNSCVDGRVNGRIPGRSAESYTLPKLKAYDGAELRPYEGRPGAMDAFALPSLRFGERVYRADAHLFTSKPKEHS